MGEGGCGLVEAAEQEQPAHRDETRLQRVGAIGVCLERGRRRRQRPRRAAEVAHGQCHLGLGDDAARARQLLVGTEAAGGAPQEFPGARVLAELGHSDAAQRKRRRVVAQGDALEGAERVAGDECARGGGDQRVHRDGLRTRPVEVSNVGQLDRTPVRVIREHRVTSAHSEDNVTNGDKRTAEQLRHRSQARCSRFNSLPTRTCR